MEPTIKLSPDATQKAETIRRMVDETIASVPADSGWQPTEGDAFEVSLGSFQITRAQDTAVVNVAENGRVVVSLHPDKAFVLQAEKLDDVISSLTALGITPELE